MMNLTPVHALSIPDSFLLPVDYLRPARTDVSLPVIDMSQDRDKVRRAVIDSGKECGFIQVVNHGISEQVMRDVYAVCHQFNEMPAEDKLQFYSEDESKPNRLYGGVDYDTLGEKCWMDTLELVYPLPSGDTKHWPHKPQRLREVVGNYTSLARGVAMDILHMLCEGLGLRPDYFTGDISSSVTIDINYYPPCPNPSRTLGLPPHCDRDLITILLPGIVPGLEITYKGDWIKVQTVPNSLQINFGLQLEVLTNGFLKAVPHRVTTNSIEPRVSVATFVSPALDCIVGPTEEFVSEDNPPRYHSLTFREFKSRHHVVHLGSSVNQVINIEDTQNGI